MLNLAELNHLGWRKIKLAVRGAQAKRKSVYEIRNKDLPGSVFPILAGLSPVTLPMCEGQVLGRPRG